MPLSYSCHYNPCWVGSGFLALCIFVYLASWPLLSSWWHLCDLPDPFGIDTCLAWEVCVRNSKQHLLQMHNYMPMWKAKLDLNEHNVLYDHSPINIQGGDDARMQQWLFGVVGHSCAHVAALCALEVLHTSHTSLFDVLVWNTQQTYLSSVKHIVSWRPPNVDLYNQIIHIGAFGSYSLGPTGQWNANPWSWLHNPWGVWDLCTIGKWCDMCVW